MRRGGLSSGLWHQRAVRAASSRGVALALAVLIGVLVAQPLRPLAGVGVFLLAAIVCLSARQLLIVTGELRQLAGAGASAGSELWSLLGLLGRPGRILPRLDGGGMDLDAAYALADLVVRSEPSVVVELGPGGSTVVMALAAASAGISMEIWSLESDPGWAARAERLVAYHSIPRCRVISAPLVPQQFGTWTGSWYSPESLALIPDHIDLLIVDAPDNFAQNDARFPAYPALRGRLGPDSHVFVHDADRPDETNMVNAWMEDPALSREHSGTKFIVLRHG